MEQRGGWSDAVTPELAAFIARRDTFFIATVNAEGQPYIQHRGGPTGFLKVIDERTLGFADFSGNRQYITVGNLNDSPKAFIFLMDFANRRRIKIWGRAEVVEDDEALREKLFDSEYGSEPERLFLFHVDAWDVNCPQHIKPQIGESISALRTRIKELEAQVRGCCLEDTTGT
jgi:predicted pyridoxine 5'-phosphate oxidase superfamily flavin-nucleotide-binding protein